MVEIFKTNVEDVVEAEFLINHILTEFPDCIANFDLEDCDKILRLETKTKSLNTTKAISILSEFGYYCSILDETTVISE